MRAWLTLLVLAPVASYAAAVRSVVVDRHGDRFHIVMSMQAKAPSQAVFKALQDYPALPRYNPEVRQVTIQHRDGPWRVELTTVVHSCVLFFCKTLVQPQLAVATPRADGGDLAIQFLPGGDFRSGHALWQVRSRDGGSSITATIDLQPDFWMPPLIGTFILRQKMTDEAQTTVTGLEAEARSGQ